MVEGEDVIQPYIGLPKEEVIDAMVERTIKKPFLQEIERMDEVEKKLTAMNSFYEKLHQLLNDGTEVATIKDNGFEVRKLKQGLMPEMDYIQCKVKEGPDGKPRQVKFNIAEFVYAIEKHISAVNKYKMQIMSNYNFVCREEDILNLVMSYEDVMRRRDVEHADIEGLMSRIDAGIESIIADLVQANIQANQEYYDSIENANVDFVVLEEKRQELLLYSDKIIHMCAEWGISPSDIDIDNDTFSLEQLSNLYDNYLIEMQKEENHRNPVALLRRLIPNTYAQFGVVVILMVVCLSPVLNAVSIGFFAWLIVAQLKNRNKVDFYTVLEGITFNVNPLNMNVAEVDESQILPETISDEDMDTMSEFDGIRKMIQEMESSMSALEAVATTHDLMPMYDIAKTDIARLCANNNAAYFSKRATMEADCDNVIINLQNLKASAITAYVPFYERYSEDIVFNTVFSFGLHDEVYEELMDLSSGVTKTNISDKQCEVKDLRNIIIRPGNDPNELKAYIRTLVANAFVNVNPSNIEFDIYDPNDGGTMLAPFYTPDMQEMFRTHRDRLTELIESLRKVEDQNLKLFRGRTVIEYNTHAQMEGLTPIKYRILIVLSQPKDIEETEALQSFFDISAKSGIYCWVVSNNLSSPTAFCAPKPFAGISNPNMDLLKDDLCRKIGNVYGQKVKTSSTNKGLMWLDFLANTFDVNNVGNGKRQFWSGSAAEFIDFYPGYLNGDKNLTNIYTLGNEGNIHAIGVGGTGAGKSVFLNHCVATLTWLYSPKQLELWMADFKGVEFGYYIGQDLWKGKFYNMNFEDKPLPHIAACLCTADPTFGSSLFKALADLSRVRYDDMMSIGVKNLPGWNDRVIPGDLKPDKLISLHSENPNYPKEWRDDELWKRVLVIVDEFQVIFEKAKEGGESANMVENIKTDLTYIAKVSRACGVHLFFTSQSMNGTLSADILNQFSLRFGLRCAKDVSMDVMGGETSSSITDKNGFLYVRDVETAAPEKQKKFKTPFIEDATDGPNTKIPKRKVIKDLTDKGIDSTDIPKSIKIQKQDLEKIVRDDIIYARVLTYGTDDYKYFMNPPKDDHYRKSAWSSKKVEFEERLKEFYHVIPKDEVSEELVGKLETAWYSSDGNLLVAKEDTDRAKEAWNKLDIYARMEIMEVAPLRQHITRCAIEARRIGFERPKPITYQESSIWEIDKLDKYYELGRNRGNLPDSGVFFIGERMSYSDANAPYNFVLGRENNTHIAAAFNSTKDIGNFFKCMYKNIQLNKVPGTVVLNSQDKDIPYLLRWDEIDLNGREALINYSCKDMVVWINKLFKARESGQNTNTDPIWIFLLGWNKGKGFVIEKDPSVTQMFVNTMALCGAYNIHVIMINSAGGITENHIKGMSYRIVGNVDKETCMDYQQSYTASKFGTPKDGWCYVKDMENNFNRSKIFISPVDVERKLQSKDIRF